MIDQQRDVLPAFAQRRHHELDDVDAIKQIFAKQALRDEVAQALVRRGNDPHVDGLAFAKRADLLQLAGLEESQQETLHPQRHLADFIQEHGAAVSHFEFAGLVAERAGEAPLHVPEQLGLEERLGQSCAIDRNKRLVAPGAALMQRLGDEFLTHAALARDENLGLGTRDASNLLLDLKE